MDAVDMHVVQHGSVLRDSHVVANVMVMPTSIRSMLARTKLRLNQLALFASEGLVICLMKHASCMRSQKKKKNKQNSA